MPPPAFSKATMVAQLSQLLVCSTILFANSRCLLSADLAVLVEETTNTVGAVVRDAALRRAQSFYCDLLGTRAAPTVLAQLPNELLWSLVPALGITIFCRAPSRPALVAAVASSLFVFCCGIPALWTLKDACGALLLGEAAPILVRGSLLHLAASPLIVLTLVSGSISGLRMFSPTDCNPTDCKKSN